MSLPVRSLGSQGQRPVTNLRVKQFCATVCFTVACHVIDVLYVIVRLFRDVCTSFSRPNVSDAIRSKAFSYYYRLAHIHKHVHISVYCFSNRLDNGKHLLNFSVNKSAHITNVIHMYVYIEYTIHTYIHMCVCGT